MTRIIATCLLISLQATSVLAQAGPWVTKRTDFGLTAVGETDVAPGAPNSTWNVLAVGLFCGARQANARRIMVYVYGLDADRLASNRTVEATFIVDGRSADLALRPQYDVALAAVEAEFVKRLTTARTASVSIKNYNSPNPDRIKMDGAAAAIRSALKGCFSG